jgi:hypothetical protein
VLWQTEQINIESMKLEGRREKFEGARLARIARLARLGKGGGLKYEVRSQKSESGENSKIRNEEDDLRRKFEGGRWARLAR